MTERETCKTCRFHHRMTYLDYEAAANRAKNIDREGYEHYFECRRQSPDIRGFPETETTDWCGEHKPKEPDNGC